MAEQVESLRPALRIWFARGTDCGATYPRGPDHQPPPGHRNELKSTPLYESQPGPEIGVKTPRSGTGQNPSERISSSSLGGGSLRRKESHVEDVYRPGRPGSS